MKNNHTLSLLLIAGISVALFSCAKMEDCSSSKEVTLDLPETPYEYSRFSNGGFDMFNGVNNDVATLGRVLFYDTRLSLNNSISCGSCHKQAIAFSDNLAFSKGFENHNTLRNTLPIQNISNNGFITLFAASSGPSLFWDGRADFLPSMVLMPITNHVEMGMSDMNAIVEKVKAQSYYKDLFVKAFSTTDIDANSVATALSSFVSSIFSGDSRFDRFNNNMASLSAIEIEGRNLFFNKYNCNSCHQTQQLNGYELGGKFANIGLDEVYTDKGREGISHDAADNGKVKIPSLRNIAMTGPYMHDGRFKSLDAVLNHYSHGIAETPGLDERLRETNGTPKRLNISEHEKTAIIAFLNTMTDFAMLTDPKFSNPFKVK